MTSHCRSPFSIPNKFTDNFHFVREVTNNFPLSGPSLMFKFFLKSLLVKLEGMMLLSKRVFHHSQVMQIWLERRNAAFYL